MNVIDEGNREVLRIESGSSIPSTGKPNQNAFVERFNKTVRQEAPNVWLFDSLAQAQQILEEWRI